MNPTPAQIPFPTVRFDGQHLVESGVGVCEQHGTTLISEINVVQFLRDTRRFPLLRRDILLTYCAVKAYAKCRCVVKQGKMEDEEWRY